MAREGSIFSIITAKYRAQFHSSLSLSLQTAYLLGSLVLAVGCGLLVIYLVWKKEFLQKPRHFIRCNLAVDDIVFTVCMIPTELCLLFSPQEGSHFQEACWVQMLVGRSSSASMFGTYLLMAVELYYFICQPLHYNSKVTTKRVGGGIAAVRAFALFFGAGSAIIQRLQDSGVNLCETEPLTSTSTSAIFISISYLAGVLAVIAIFIIYYLVFKEARKQQERDENRNLWLCQTKAFKTMAPHITILAVLLASIIFLVAFARVLYNTEEKLSVLIVFRVAKMIYLTLSSVVNPIIYSFRHPEFRPALRELCGMPQNLPAAMAPPPVRRGQDMEMAVFSTPDRGQWASRREFRPIPSSSQGEGQLEEETPPPSPAQIQAETHSQQAPPPSPAQTQAEAHGQQAPPPTGSPAQTQAETYGQQTSPPSPAQTQAEAHGQQAPAPSRAHSQEEEQPEQALAPLSGQCNQKTRPGRPMVLTVQAEIHPSPPPRRQYLGQTTASPEQRKHDIEATSASIPKTHIDEDITICGE
ncbi:OR4A15 [Branchiostoma lanceolatum]|uniref:OR4A15 protein n=1 Tax=Branchiostoma lanceolatum TaxID=7740 RepID=A0A8J9ZLY9_BRALA|nr:OR4A15 [Branchiostoma lanceolatum]